MAKKKTPNVPVESVPLMLRLPIDVHEWIKQKARDETRSLNSQVVAVLKKEMQGEQSPPTLPANR